MHIRHFCGNRGDILLVLITYDVNTENESGKSRLRNLAKQCVNDGVRVQNSYLNDKQKQKIECLGVKKGISLENTLIF